jgi:predicted AAA+ superfamily ATPase
MITRKMVNFPYNSSFFLFGPRQTGKTTALLAFLEFSKAKKEFNYWHLNLLLSHNFLMYQKEPGQFARDAIYQIEKLNIKYIFIDEVQKIPILLDEVHQLIETYKNVHFILSGSSARKLKNGGANLLGGRALLRYLFPLLFIELQDSFDLDRALTTGTLPGIYFDEQTLAFEKITSYVETYLKEEIIAEALVRKTGDFHRFLDISAQHATEIVNYDNIARESATKSATVKSYFKILEDTLIGFSLPAWDKSIRKQLALHPKFYFFDNGVLNGILGTIDGVKFPEFRGKLFEQWILNEVRAAISYSQLPVKMHFWRTKAGNEVDLILSKLGKPIAAIEIKAQKEIGKKHLSGLKSFAEDNKIKNLILIAEVNTPSIFDGIEVLPFSIFLSTRLSELLHEL